MIYAEGIHGQFRLGYGTQYIHVAAAMADDRVEIDDLVACGADSNARDAGGCAPLHYAAWNNPVGEVAAALDASANPAGSGEAVEDARGTARYSCPAFGKTRAYRRLMQAGSRLRVLKD